MKSSMKFHIVKSSFIFVYLFGYFIVDEKLKTFAEHYFQIYPYLIFNHLAFIPVGLILGFNRFYEAWNGSGKWKVNGPSIVFIALPSLYLLLVPYVLSLPLLLPFGILTSPSIGVAAQIIFGYTMITSVYKESEGRKS
ncbi:hypothetical protein LCL89_06470 [Halobacillus yeomjeoni]|uniref:hypothetical protein n=1 Tax=Halobacillus yeomjeoni TaxID=311194 RepID=UPI001CD699D1|nr:hypothetical protein [Halobacillus yeomjeoni]MCA0983700.1 hypothetical protein [Halobacillus yeomjeoni]